MLRRKETNFSKCCPLFFGSKRSQTSIIIGQLGQSSFYMAIVHLVVKENAKGKETNQEKKSTRIFFFSNGSMRSSIVLAFPDSVDYTRVLLVSIVMLHI